MYECIKSQVFSDGDISFPFLSDAGGRQGESYPPFLFSLFINDLKFNVIMDGVNGASLKLINRLNSYMKLFVVLKNMYNSYIMISPTLLRKWYYDLYIVLRN